MGKYRKLIAAVVGLAVLFVYRQWGLDLTGSEDMLVEIVMQVGTAVAVYAFPNDPA